MSRSAFFLLLLALMFSSLLVQPLSRDETSVSGAYQAQDDYLIGVWSTNMCGKSVIVKVVPNEEKTKSGFDYRLKGILVNGKEIGYGFKNGDDWFYLSPMATTGVYEGKTVYRNLLFKKWFPTRLVMSDINSFTVYDDTTVNTCGGSTHVYFRKEPRTESRIQPQEKTISTGTGFLVWNTPLILTANHVIEDATNITVHFPSGADYTATVSSRDVNNDIAILRLQNFTNQQSGFQLDIQTPILVGETVSAIGYPISSVLGRQPSIVSGQISSSVGVQDSPTEFRMTTPVNPGNSGGPILNPDGKVIGIAVAVIRRYGNRPIEGVTFGIKMATAFPLLQQAGLKFAEKIADQIEEQPLTPAQIFSKYARDVVMIEAKRE